MKNIHEQIMEAVYNYRPVELEDPKFLYLSHDMYMLLNEYCKGYSPVIPIGNTTTFRGMQVMLLADFSVTEHVGVA